MKTSTQSIFTVVRMCLAGFLLASFPVLPIGVWFAPSGSMTQRILMIVAVAQACTALRIGVHQWHDARSKDHE